MKKIYLFLVLLLAVGLVGAFAQDDGASFSGNIDWFMTADEDDTDDVSNIGKARLFVDVPAGEYASAHLDVRSDMMRNSADQGGDAVPAFRINQFYAKADVSGALGIEGVGITGRFGTFEEWNSIWAKGAPAAGRAHDLTESFAIGGAGGTESMAFDFAIPETATLKTYFEFASGSDLLGGYKLAAQSSSLVPGLNAIVSYSGYGTDPDETDGYAGHARLEAAYDVPMGSDMMSLTVPFSVTYFMADDAGDDVTGWHVGANFGYDIYSANLGLGGQSGDALADEDVFQVADVDLAVSPVDFADLYARFDMDPLADSDLDEELLKSVDIGAKAMFGSLNMYAGYVLSMEDGYTTKVVDDDNTGRAGVFESGFYLGARLGF